MMKWKSVIENLRQRLISATAARGDYYLDLAGQKTVRLVMSDPEACKLVRRELGWLLTSRTDNPDATIYLWKEPDALSFARTLIEPGTQIDQGAEYVVFKAKEFSSDGKGTWNEYPTGQVNFKAGTVYLASGNEFFYGTSSFEPEKWISEGHLFVQILFRILNELPSTKLVHGACVGLDGKGLLLCARGQRGKSTLAVTAMLKGFDFVSEDYLILEQNAEGLYASPIYSMVTLSPFMYDKLYDGLSKAKFIGVGPFKGKYLFDITDFRDQVKWHYPVRACVFPEISPEATEPRYELCDPAEKNRAITHMAHSTLFQMWCAGLKRKQSDQEFILAIIRMLRGLDFYKIILTPDIFRNADCLRSLVSIL